MIVLGNISTNGTIRADNMLVSNYQVIHAGNWPSYCAAAGHSHSYLPLVGGRLTGNLTIQHTPTTAGITDQNLYLSGSYARDGNITGAPGIGFYEDGCGWGILKHNNNVFKFMSYDLSKYTIIKAGWLDLEQNGVTCQIGPLNSSYVHFTNNTGVPFYFQHSIMVNGALCIYNANSKGCGSSFPSNPTTGQIFFKF